jgi:hypothetical protein
MNIQDRKSMSLLLGMIVVAIVLFAVSATNIMPAKPVSAATTVSVILSSASAVPGQPVTIRASGLTPSSQIPAGGIKLGSIAWNANTIALDPAGNLAAVILEVGVGATAGAPTLRAPGNYTVAVTDAAGTQGAAAITIPVRSISVSPASSIWYSEVTVKGAGYTRNTLVVVNYGTPALQTVGVQTNEKGEFAVTFAIPTAAPVGTSVTLTAVEPLTGFQNSNVASHAVAAPTLTANATSVSIGGQVKLTGKGFPKFWPVTAVSIGGLSAGGGAGFATDDKGDLEISVAVPAQPLGQAPVGVVVGNAGAALIASANITLAEPVAPPASIVTQMQPIAGVLKRVWAWDNAAKKWLMYDPKAPASANDLLKLAKGQAAIVSMSEGAQLVTPAATYTLSAGDNIVAWLGP